METIAEFRFVYKEAIIEIGDTSAKKLHKCSCQGGGTRPNLCFAVCGQRSQFCVITLASKYFTGSNQCFAKEAIVLQN